ncbi:MAG: N4-bis(aminopropyl)spermidine synthase [Thermoanaerobacter sp.]|nr:N4-bis(aminopropyl)spermidine synthase [Thermoanaerobacter sp.]
MENLQDIAHQIYQKTGVMTSSKDVEKILSAAAATPHFWEIITLSQKPFSVVAEMIEILRQKNLLKVEKNGDIKFNSKGLEYLGSLKIAPKRTYTCHACEGRGINFSKLEDLIKKFDQVTVNRPKAISDYDQGFVTTQTVVGRIALMAERGDLEGKKLLVLGDDDLVSIAAGLSGMPTEIVVMEIDDRLVEYINEVANKYNLPIKAMKYDFRDKLPEEYVGYFDTFITDPPETIEALEICIGRGISALSKEGCAGYFGLTLIEASLEKWNVFQQILASKFKVVVTDIIHDFNHYVNWDYLLNTVGKQYEFVQVEPKLNWYRSSMYRIETLKDSKGIENEYKPCELYVDEEALIYRGDKA